MTSLSGSTTKTASPQICQGDFKIPEQNTRRGDLVNLRSFLSIFLHENDNNVIEDEVTTTCGVLPSELLGSKSQKMKVYKV
ncbi:MAG: hypothetical protein WAZ77_20300 [Candidatus Nitrosopolaris sp.]|jgi:hypothetical protein